MTAQRALGVLIAAVLAIAGAFWLSTQRHMERATLAGDKVLPGLRAVLNDVSELRLRRGDGSRVTLARKDTNWIVVDRDFPADGVRVRRLLLDLADLAVLEEKTHDPANYAQLGVDEPASPKTTGTKLEAIAGKQTFALIVGKPSGGKAAFARVPDRVESVLATPQLSVDTDPKRWIDRTLIDVRSERVQSITIVKAGHGYTASRTSRDAPELALQDLPTGRVPSSAGAATPLASSLTDFTFDDVRATPQAVAPQDAATIRTFDGLIVDLHGREDGDRRWISLTTRYDAEQRKRYEAAASDAKDAKPLLPVASDVQALATRVATLADKREFEIPTYKFDALFKPLDELLAPAKP